MSGIVEFISAQLAEDERVARAAGVDSLEWREDSSWLHDLRDPLPSQRRAYGLPIEVTLISDADAAHIARHDPARVLAEVDAKRRLLDAAMLELADDPDDEAAAWTIQVLALPYAGQPGYREEWRP